ncbi:uncharacterized protein KGF55_000488 [Candida pseudojiufengensis]|uniref:uncharacterized protein n=1 Tax=Candida pseudojiufengensis TaxID=497109 RepID=UPI0022257DF3|nr:uncharacterized protein KGF55_000488 [Candida pseudojiufengensis]KAI5966179.1 hypothetical protein KGF55_000488 [Candida pseudojiufengensis]
MDGLLNKAKELSSNVDSKDLKDAYDTYNKTDGTLQDKGKAVYENYNKSHSNTSSSDSKTDSKTESSSESKIESK